MEQKYKMSESGKGRSLYDEYIYAERLQYDKNFELNISFSVKEGVEISDVEKNQLISKNGSIKMILEQRKYFLDGFTSTKDPAYLKFIQICNEQLLIILGISAKIEEIIPLPINDLYVQKQADYINHLKLKMMQASGIPKEFLGK